MSSEADKGKPKCELCEADERRTASWQQSGGQIPVKLCHKVHGRPCKVCKNVLTRNPSKMCDDCFNEHWRIEYGFTAK